MSRESTSEDKVNLTAFLSENPQTYPVTVLMEKLYGTELNTMTEWNKILEKTLNKKITQ